MISLHQSEKHFTDKRLKDKKEKENLIGMPGMNFNMMNMIPFGKKKEEPEIEEDDSE